MIIFEPEVMIANAIANCFFPGNITKMDLEQWNKRQFAIFKKLKTQDINTVSKNFLWAKRKIDNGEITEKDFK